MHEFNTFRDDSFQFPNLCAKCAAKEPAETWELKSSEINFPEGMPAYAGDNKPREYNTYLTNVPVCTACLAVMNRRSRLCWLLGGVVGAVAGCQLFGYMDNIPKLDGPGLYFVPFAAAIFAALAAGYVLKVIFVGALSFAKYNGREQKIKFQNKEFQEQFDRLNFNYSPQTGQYASGARA